MSGPARAPSGPDSTFSAPTRLRPRTNRGGSISERTRDPFPQTVDGFLSEIDNLPMAVTNAGTTDSNRGEISRVVRTISVVVPVYQGERTLDCAHRRARASDPAPGVPRGPLVPGDRSDHGPRWSPRRIRRGDAVPGGPQSVRRPDLALTQLRPASRDPRGNRPLHGRMGGDPRRGRPAEPPRSGAVPRPRDRVRRPARLRSADERAPPRCCAMP